MLFLYKLKGASTGRPHLWSNTDQIKNSSRHQITQTDFLHFSRAAGERRKDLKQGQNMEVQMVVHKALRNS